MVNFYTNSFCQIPNNNIRSFFVQQSEGMTTLF
jgi:hypothetical protein